MIYRFGLYEFDADASTLRKSGRPVPLEPQPAKALARLLASPGETVSRHQIKQAVWGADTHVDFDRGLAYCLSSIRRALGDSAENPRFIQTIPRQGYRLIAPVQTATPAPPPANAPVRRNWLIAAAVALVLIVTAAALILPHQQRMVIAVSIFDNESGLSQHDRLVANLSNLVLARLSEIAPDQVALIGNVPILRQPRNIRNILAVRNTVKADYLILGQLQPSQPGGLRFITHLIRLSDQTHLKANRIQLPDGNVAGLESAGEHAPAEPPALFKAALFLRRSSLALSTSAARYSTTCPLAEPLSPPPQLAAFSPNLTPRPCRTGCRASIPPWPTKWSVSATAM